MSRKSPITSHVLNTSTGKPAVGMAIELTRQAGDSDRWEKIGATQTDADGRAGDLLTHNELVAGAYRLKFETGAYFQQAGEITFYPSVTVDFQVHSTTEHFHVPLLISPFGYSTYRGS